MFKKTLIFATLSALWLAAAAPVIAADAEGTMNPVAEALSKILPAKDETETKNAPLPVPRFVTLATEEVNVRTGPGTRYPILYIVRKGGLPVEITKEFEVWRKIKDVDGDGGWVHKAMLSGRRGVVVKGQVQPLLREPYDSARPVARLEPGVIAELKSCKDAWCSLKVATYEGWMKKENLWGVYADEQVKE